MKIAGNSPFGQVRILTHLDESMRGYQRHDYVAVLTVFLFSGLVTSLRFSPDHSSRAWRSHQNGTCGSSSKQELLFQ